MIIDSCTTTSSSSSSSSSSRTSILTTITDARPPRRWGADWIVKARYSPTSLVAVTWSPGASIKQAHLFWGHPEDITAPSMVRSLGPGQPGADLLAGAAAALAATAHVFKKEDPSYSDDLIAVAQGLYDQAKNQEGFYSDSVPEVTGYYKSFSFIDDMAWAAAWLALATGDEQTAEEARLYWLRHISDEGGGEGRRCVYTWLRACALWPPVGGLVLLGDKTAGSFALHMIVSPSPAQRPLQTNKPRAPQV